MAEIKWLNEDLSFLPGFEQSMPEDVRDYAKDAKDLPSLIRRGADTQKEFHSRVKMPTDPAERRKFMAEHFKAELAADEQARRKAAESESAKAKGDREKAESEAAQTRMDEADKAIRKAWDKEYDTNLELARRAIRSDHFPKGLKAAIAGAEGVEPDKLTDDQIRHAIAHDPIVAETALSIARLTRDGHTERGDGHANDKSKERYPSYPRSPEVYARAPDDDPEKLWFTNRGAEYENGRYVAGSFSGPLK